MTKSSEAKAAARRNKNATQANELDSGERGLSKASSRDFSGKCVAVVGDGASAMASVALYAAAGWHITWISGGGTRVLSPLPTMEAGLGAEALVWLARHLGLELPRPESVNAIREFRNKSFRAPAWHKLGGRDEKIAELKDALWVPEARYIALDEVRFGTKNLAEVESILRDHLIALPQVLRHDGLPIEGIVRDEESSHWSLKFGSGEKVQVDRVVYADRWSKLGALEGLPKPVPFTRGRNPSGLLQAVFRHSRPVGLPGLDCGFFAPLHKEAGEDSARNVLGYFFDGGLRSVWTTFLAQDEVEDNHLIAKKLRRMKQAIEKLFVGSEWCGEGAESILSTIESEHVAFEESTVCHSGAAPEKCTRLSSMPGVVFLTDGYGPSVAWAQLVDHAKSDFTSWCDEVHFLEWPTALESREDLAHDESISHGEATEASLENPQ